MTVFQIALFVVLGIIAIFALTDRICKCVEQKYVLMTISEAIASGNKSIKELKEAVENKELDKFIL